MAEGRVSESAAFETRHDTVSTTPVSAGRRPVYVPDIVGGSRSLSYPRNSQPLRTLRGLRERFHSPQWDDLPHFPGGGLDLVVLDRRVANSRRVDVRNETATPLFVPADHIHDDALRTDPRSHSDGRRRTAYR